MSLSNGGQPLEVRDALGAIRGYFVPEEELQGLIDERDGLRRKVEELEKQVADLGEYEKMYRAWSELGVPPPRECEIEEMRRNGVSLEELLAEIRVPPQAGGAQP
jgi:hypothetical protein